MYGPYFTDGEFVDAAGINTAFAVLQDGVREPVEGLHTAGLGHADYLTFSQAGMVVTVTAPPPFFGMFTVSNYGVLARARGNVLGVNNPVASVDFTSLIPGSGSVTAYLLAYPATVGQQAYQVVGPPIGHPDYDPTFVPYTSYAVTSDTIIFAANTNPGDNIGSLEIARTTLTAGQTVISSLDLTHQVRAGAVLSRNGEVLAADLAAGAAATNVGTLGGVLTGNLPNPGMAAGAAVANIGFTPIQQGGGFGQLTNKVYAGWNGTNLAVTVDSTNLGNVAFTPVGGVLTGLLPNPGLAAGVAVANIGYQPARQDFSNVYADATPGTHTFTVPAGIYKLKMEATGGGGAGGASVNGQYGGGGGASGGYAEGFAAVYPGQVITYTVGAGGVCNPGSAGTTAGAGGFTEIVTFVKAMGGPGGGSNSPTSAGGVGAQGIQTVYFNGVGYNGGDGGDGQGATTVSSTGNHVIYGGHGGASAHGGGGRAGAGAGLQGQNFGAGGGGSYDTTGLGGSGQVGLVVFCY